MRGAWAVGVGVGARRLRAGDGYRARLHRFQHQNASVPFRPIALCFDTTVVSVVSVRVTIWNRTKHMHSGPTLFWTPLSPSQRLSDCEIRHAGRCWRPRATFWTLAASPPRWLWTAKRLRCCRNDKSRRHPHPHLGRVERRQSSWEYRALYSLSSSA